MKSITRAQATALLMGGAALGATASRVQAQAPALETIRVATFPSENGAEAYYANDMGFFAKAGIDVTISTTQGDSITASAVTSNAVDIGYVGVGTLAALHAKGIPMVLVAPASEYLAPETRGIAAIVLPANSTVRSAKDLNGKIVAVSTIRTIAEAGVRGWMDQNGGDSSTVKFIEVPLVATNAALNAGRFDAALITEPFLGEAKKIGRVLAYGYDGVAKHFMIAVWFTTPEYARDHPDLVRRFASVIHDTAVWANKNPDKSGPILAKYSKMDPAIVAGMARSRYAERMDTQLMQPIIDVFAHFNGFKPFPASEFAVIPAR